MLSPPKPWHSRQALCPWAPREWDGTQWGLDLRCTWGFIRRAGPQVCPWPWDAGGLCGAGPAAGPGGRRATGSGHCPAPNPAWDAATSPWAASQTPQQNSPQQQRNAESPRPPPHTHTYTRCSRVGGGHGAGGPPGGQRVGGREGRKEAGPSPGGAAACGGGGRGAEGDAAAGPALPLLSERNVSRLHHCSGTAGAGSAQGARPRRRQR